MFSGNDSLPTAVLTAKEHDLKLLSDESAKTLELDNRQMATVEAYLHDAWFFGIRTGYQVMVKTKLGQTDPGPVIAGMQAEFQELMESLADELDTTVGTTIAAWDYLGRAWIAGVKFWEVEIAARVKESQNGGGGVSRGPPRD